MNLSPVKTVSGIDHSPLVVAFAIRRCVLSCVTHATCHCAARCISQMSRYFNPRTASARTDIDTVRFTRLSITCVDIRDRSLRWCATCACALLVSKSAISISEWEQIVVSRVSSAFARHWFFQSIADIIYKVNLFLFYIDIPLNWLSVKSNKFW